MVSLFCYSLIQNAVLAWHAFSTYCQSIEVEKINNRKQRHSEIHVDCMLMQPNF